MYHKNMKHKPQTGGIYFLTAKTLAFGIFILCQTWWTMSLILAVRELRQYDGEFEMRIGQYNKT